MYQPVPEFSCDVVETPTSAVVRVAGELDLASTPEVEEALHRLATQKKLVTLDLRGLVFMDSTGLRLMIEIDALARQDGFHFEIVRGNDLIHRIFQMSGVEEHLTIVDEPAVSAAS